MNHTMRVWRMDNPKTGEKNEICSTYWNWGFSILVIVIFGWKYQIVPCISRLPLALSFSSLSQYPLPLFSRYLALLTLSVSSLSLPHSCLLSLFHPSLSCSIFPLHMLFQSNFAMLQNFNGREWYLCNPNVLMLGDKWKKGKMENY